MSIEEKLAKVRELYPEDFEKIEAEQQRISALLRNKNYAMLPETQELVDLCRTDILVCRKKLATVRSLSPEARDELWNVIEARSWFLRIVARDFDQELAAIESQLDADLAN